MTRERRWWVAGATVVVAVIAVFVFWHRSAPRSAEDVSVAPNVPLVTAREGTFVERVEAHGRIGPPSGSSAKLAFAQAGILRAIDVQVGQTVAIGQQLAELDRAALAATLAEARADANLSDPLAGVAGAQARLAAATEKLDTLENGGPSALSSRIAAESAARQAALTVETDRATLDRDQVLLQAGVVAGKDVDAARSQLEADESAQGAADAHVAAAGTDFQAELKQAQADVASARSDVQTVSSQASAARARFDAAQIAYANGVLSAPAGGVVLSILKHPGEVVDPTVPVIEIGPALGHSVTLNVPAAEAARIVPGDPATLRTSSGAATPGTVTAVVPAVDPATQLATVVVGGAPAGAVASDALTATIDVGRVRGIVVPSTAIVQDPQTGRTVVFVHDANPKAGESAFQLRDVVVRASDATSASIASGLHAGERIAAQGGYMLLAPAGG